ncbi:MAG: heme-binding domain-containing protein [Bacteroidetes bacterium]|nr:heme-binding domain-containing protein [Bacteroidota bacterium]
MKTMLLVLLAIVLGIQLFRSERSNPPVMGDLRAPAAVKEVLRESCYDCHSNETIWPWYSAVNPVGWLVAADVIEGREHLNFSDWENFEAQKRWHMKQEILEVVESGEMPLSVYLLMHGNARLSTEDRAVLTQWVQSEDSMR